MRNVDDLPRPLQSFDCKIFLEGLGRVEFKCKRRCFDQHTAHKIHRFDDECICTWPLHNSYKHGHTGQEFRL